MRFGLNVEDTKWMACSFTIKTAATDGIQSANISLVQIKAEPTMPHLDLSIKNGVKLENREWCLVKSYWYREVRVETFGSLQKWKSTTTEGSQGGFKNRSRTNNGQIGTCSILAYRVHLNPTGRDPRWTIWEKPGKLWMKNRFKRGRLGKWTKLNKILQIQLLVENTQRRFMELNIETVDMGCMKCTSV